MFKIQKNEITGRTIVEIFGLRMKFKGFVSNANINEKMANLMYELADPRTLQQIRLPKVVGVYDAIYKLIASDKSLARFGDGEFKLMLGESINFQKYDSVLANRLNEVFQNNLDNLMVGIPDTFGFCQSDYFRRVMILSRDYLYKYMNFDKEYYDANITRQFQFVSEEMGNDYYKKMKEIWLNKDIIIVEGAGSRLGIGNDLFNDAKSIKRVICPIKNAFSKYNEILDVCSKQPKDKLFIIALGPTATVLAYDLTKLGYRALDMGHIDTMYEWFIRKTTKHISIEGKIVFNNERNKQHLKPCSDKRYYEQIIANFED